MSPIQRLLKARTNGRPRAANWDRKSRGPRGIGAKRRNPPTWPRPFVFQWTQEDRLWANAVTL